MILPRVIKPYRIDNSLKDDIKLFFMNRLQSFKRVDDINSTRAGLIIGLMN